MEEFWKVNLMFVLLLFFSLSSTMTKALSSSLSTFLVNWELQTGLVVTVSNLFYFNYGFKFSLYSILEKAKARPLLYCNIDELCHIELKKKQTQKNSCGCKLWRPMLWASWKTGRSSSWQLGYSISRTRQYVAEVEEQLSMSFSSHMQRNQTGGKANNNEKVQWWTR